MSDNYPVAAEVVRKNGVRGIFSTAGGVGLLIVKALIGFGPVGFIVGGAMIVLGIGGLFSKNKDKITTTVLSVIAGLGVAILIPHSPVPTLIGLGALGLLIYGGVNLFKFFKGIKSRA